MKRRTLLLVTIALTIQSLFAAAPTFTSHSFSGSSGFVLPYRFCQPVDIVPEKRYPLILFLHGAGDWGTNNSSQLVNFPYHFLDSANRSSFPCYAVAPQCTEKDPWSSFPNYPAVNTPSSPTRSTAEVLALLDSLCASTTLHIDPTRIYAIGFSLGGEGVFDIITRSPERFAAAVPVCGIADTAKSLLMKTTPLWIFHGDKDDINSVTYSRMIVEALTKIGTPPKYTEYAGMNHYVWSKAFAEPDLLPWLFSQKRPAANMHPSTSARIGTPGGVNVKRYRTHFELTTKNHSAPLQVELFSLSGKLLYTTHLPGAAKVHTITFPAGIPARTPCILRAAGTSRLIITPESN